MVGFGCEAGRENGEATGRIVGGGGEGVRFVQGVYRPRYILWCYSIGGNPSILHTMYCNLKKSDLCCQWKYRN